MSSTHINFEGFFEDFTASTPSQKVEVFVAAGGQLDILMTTHGPLTLAQVYAVSVC